MADMGTCRRCRKPIVFVRMKSGKTMPCDPEYRSFVKGGKDRIVLPEGKVVSGTITDNAVENDGWGYVSHFATCPYADQFRR